MGEAFVGLGQYHPGARGLRALYKSSDKDIYVYICTCICIYIYTEKNSVRPSVFA